MTALPPVPNVLKIEYDWTIGEDMTALTRFHVRYTGGPPSGADCNTLAGDHFTTASTDLLPLLSTANALAEVRVVDLSSASGAQGVHVGPASGSRSGAGMFAQACLLVNEHIARRYRGGKPRMYLPLGIASDLADPQTWSSAFLTPATVGVFAWYVAFIAFLAGTTQCVALVNLSYYSGFTNVPYGSPTKYRRTPTVRSSPVVDDIQTLSIRSKVATQRRRTLIRGG